MKMTRVQYTIRGDFVEENKKNIEAVVRELRAQNNGDVRYAVYVHDDGRTFMHLAQHNTVEAERFPTSLDAFRHFQSQLKEHLEVAPKVEKFTLVQSATPIF